jgi:deoxyribodipyrimidine photo-lyase
MHFPTDYNSILERINAIDPQRYAGTRNFIDGAVTGLSPYISRGVISLRQVKDAVLVKGYKAYQIEKFLQELAWREYWQRVWWHSGDRLFTDLKKEQENVAHRQMIKSVAAAAIGIDAIDAQIAVLLSTGYMHNHVRMYTAGITCNLGKAHWLQPSRWMYYHLLDGDIASNALSWQWVAGAFSSKKYIANQENVNKYLYSKQLGTFLDKPYETILDQPIPEALLQTFGMELHTTLPLNDASFSIDPAKPLLLYHSYNLNPHWRKEMDANRLLLLEPAHFNKFPVNEKVLAFIIQLAKDNIPGIQIFVGKVTEIPGIESVRDIFSIDHPIARDYPGTKDPYPWLFPQVSGYFPSFFSFWKKAQKYLTAQ